MEAIKFLLIIITFVGNIDGLKIPSFLEKNLSRLPQRVQDETLRKEIFGAMALYGMRNNYALSYITSMLAVKEMEMGEERRAEKWYELSKEISPDMPTPSYLYARSMWRRGIKGIFRSFVPQLEYVIKKYTNPITSLELIQIWWEELFYLSIIFPAIFALFIGIRFFERIYHFFKEWLAIIFSNWGIVGFIIFVIVFPFIIGLPVGYLIIGYIVFFALFATTKEWKILLLAIFSIVLFTISSFFAIRASIYMSPSNFSYLLTVLNYHSGNWEAFSKKANLSHNLKPEEMFINGLYYLKVSKYEKAYLIFDELLKRNYKPWKCYTNMGIASYAMGRKNEAFSRFKKSLKIRPMFNAEAYYDISVIYFERAEIEKGEKAIDKAKEEASEMIERFKAFTGRESINTRFIPSELSISEIRSGLSREMYMPYIKDKFSFLFPDFAFNKIIFAGIAGILLILIALLPFIRSAFPRNCSRCKKVYCLRCEESPLAELCYTCYTVYVIKEKVAPEERVQFELETSRRLNVKKWMRWITNFLLPGGGDLLSEREISGTLKLLLIFFVAISFFMGNITRGVIPFSLEFTPFEYTVRGIFIAFIWLLTNLKG